MADDDGPEVLDLGAVDEPGPAGAPPPPPGGRPAVPRRVVLTVAALAAAGGVAAVVRSRGSAPPPTRSAPTPSPTPSPASTSSAPLPADVVVGPAPGPLLAGERIDVFGLGTSSLVRVEVATGRVTQTALPSQADGGLSLVPVRGGVLVHHDDNGATYLIPDGAGARDAPVALDGAGPLLPGPDLGHVWVLDISAAPITVTLVGIDGRPTGTAVRLPPSMAPSTVPDGGGFPLVAGISGAYWARPDGLVRVTTGTVLATGRTGWLVVDCDDRARCAGALVDRSGRRRVAAGIAGADEVVGPVGFLTGALDRNGSTAALWTGDPSSDLRLVLVDLGTGRHRPTELDLVAGSAQDQLLAWSPDGRWLFSVDSSGRIVVVDPATGRARPLVPGTTVPAVPVVQKIALRTG